ncbi:MAG: hypothetical protein DWB56_14830 [Candidatus Jettenia sp.]|uniref:Uncharacterized protein n=1 Tax=Candidatus Jettenia caeni TaxID=247490 RepID=I3ILS0_9BACT|nr:hypothetical protein [Candidatus Jettenia sp. AMX1]KAA0243581.1 MAG: hypothetical protein EDM70_10015 [Candidatus Brocadia sp. AMX2]MBC6930207.1 hypothetical protein [Candidatus Jettenia sp.]GAB62665.1 hypothetical protein KSU1_C1069 [Candidatus Jettenia caeni]MCQ3927081.1 hypothetical protein [Candidatus Jettenia sp.]MDL1939895.1 hypothetical protein [Candidatus Jettenia sp. AMX1]
MSENICPSPKYCEVALKLEEIHGDIKSQLSSGTEIMKSLKAQQEAFCDRYEKILEKQDARIAAVEKKVWYASGGVSAITAAVTAFITRVLGGHGG